MRMPSTLMHDGLCIYNALVESSSLKLLATSFVYVSYKIYSEFALVT